MTHHLDASLRALQRDPHFAPVIKKYGPAKLSRPNLKPGDIFQSLCRSIIYQQISGKAAASILARFRSLTPRKEFPAPKDILSLSDVKLRSAGLSPQKTSYLKDLAQKFADGDIRHTELDSMTSAEIVEHLTAVKGVGEWTAHMVMIFTLQRLDILPTGDLGIRKGFQKLYGLRSMPDKVRMEKLAREWRAHASVASWYLWRLADEGKR